MNNTLHEAGWNFDNSYARLPKTFFSFIDPVPVVSPELVIMNDQLAVKLGLNPEGIKNPEGIAMLCGNRIPKGAMPLSQAYAGHQFGYFTMLGDGRANLLGEHITPGGERFDIQLKGSGRTPYSRSGDGRAALGPMLREYIISEAMHSLGIPTTRSLAVVSTGESVFRETELKGAILTRVAASHLRVGTFQYIASRGNIEELLILTDYTLKRHFPDSESVGNKGLFLLKQVISRQAELIAQWQMVGFIHGVMNTDNMAISGETIDYGPCAFMDMYDPATVFSSIDHGGRYAYGNQPHIAGWNLARFAETLLPLIHEDQDQAVKLAQDELNVFSELYQQNWISGMRSKLGIFNSEREDEILIHDFLEILQRYRMDYTNSFRILSLDGSGEIALSENEDYSRWHKLWRVRLSRQSESKEFIKEMMRNYNPSVIPRNHRVEEALEAAVERKDYSVMEKLLEVISNPYDYSLRHGKYYAPADPNASKYQTFCGT